MAASVADAVGVAAVGMGAAVDINVTVFDVMADVYTLALGDKGRGSSL